ncbi:Fe-S cluster protein [Clostridia bacterium]|nr:Fe-S cluster protein [Clostridia bacterium]
MTKHSVHIDEELCKGCTNCLKRCPTEAIRVRGGLSHATAKINELLCIDCGECIRRCPHHAKLAVCNPLSESLPRDEFKHIVVLPPPALYAQYNNLEDKGIVNQALLRLGFDAVFEVAAAAEIISEKTREIIKGQKRTGGESLLPLISSACPAVLKLIQIRFPTLVPHILPLCAPVTLAAQTARREESKRMGISPSDIGVVFLTPCPAKVTAVRDHSEPMEKIDRVVSVSDIYKLLPPIMEEISLESVGDDIVSEPTDYIESSEVTAAGKIGIGWGSSGGESAGLLSDSYLAADGIENVLQVLEELEDGRLPTLDYIELNSCPGGCVGGVFTVENPFIARTKLNVLRKYLPVAGYRHITETSDISATFTELPRTAEYSLTEALRLVRLEEELYARLPGLDCGCCGSPTCRAFAVDVVKGEVETEACIKLRSENQCLSHEVPPL